MPSALRPWVLAAFARSSREAPLSDRAHSLRSWIMSTVLPKWFRMVWRARGPQSWVVAANSAFGGVPAGFFTFVQNDVKSGLGCAKGGLGCGDRLGGANISLMLEKFAVGG